MPARRALLKVNRAFARIWAGPSELPASLRLEWQLVLVRWVGIVFVSSGLLVVPLIPARLAIAYTIIALDIVFNAVVQFGLPRRPQFFTNGLVTMLGDSVITVMVVGAVGGTDTAIEGAFFLVTVSAALRYGYRSLLVVAFFVARDWMQTSPPYSMDGPFIIRSVFLCLTAIVTSYIYRQARDMETELLRQQLQQAAAINEALEYQANHDLLTSLPNRVLLNSRLEAAIRSFDAGGAGMALLLMDLDRFKEINDTFGHHVGDKLLQQIGLRVETAIGASAMLARLGGDEFAAVLRAVDNDAAIQVARAVASAVQEAFVIGGYIMGVGVSIGIAVLPEHGRSAESLLRHADVAMYVAKRRQIGWAVYSAELDDHSPDRVALAADLHQAIEEDQLTLHFQPQLSMSTGRIVGMEALVRWRHPKRGMIAPDQFIPLAEASGLIGSLTHWVLNAALREIQALGRDGVLIPVSVNFSMRDLHNVDLPRTVAGLLQRWSLEPGRLIIEITESSLMEDSAGASQILTSLSEMGVGISIDDFGTGYSSLNYLKQLPVDELKIDKSFVQQLVTDKKDVAIVRSTIRMAHDLGLRVVAEGIEDQKTWGLLRELMCDSAQGYLISRPLPVDQLLPWTREHMRPPEALLTAA